MKNLLHKLKPLLLALFLSSLCLGKPTSAKTISFDGQYRMKYSSAEYYVLNMNQYPSSSGKEKGSFEIFYYYKPSGGMNPWVNGTLKKIGTNKYQYKKGKGKITFQVYTKKIIVKANKQSGVNEVSGTYKLKENRSVQNIRFAGKYQIIEKYDGYKEYYTLKMYEYASPKGKTVGSFKLIQKSSYRENGRVEGQLKKIGTNKYQYKTGKVKIIFKVYKNKVAITQNKTAIEASIDFTGTYPKKEIYSLS